jgi:hypothetical protein
MVPATSAGQWSGRSDARSTQAGDDTDIGPFHMVLSPTPRVRSRHTHRGSIIPTGVSNARLPERPGRVRTAALCRGPGTPGAARSRRSGSSLTGDSVHVGSNVHVVIRRRARPFGLRPSQEIGIRNDRTRWQRCAAGSARDRVPRAEWSDMASRHAALAPHRSPA